MKKSRRAVCVVSLAVGWLVCGAAIAGASPTSGATASSYNYSGGAYGTTATVGSIVKSGPSSPVGTGCGTGPGVNITRSTAAVNAAPLFSTGAINSSLTTGATSISTSSDIVSAQILSGLINANEVKAVSTTAAGTSGNTYSSSGSQFVGLTVGGVPISGTPAPNTTITLAGVGKVVLNQQVQSGHSLTVNMIHVYVTTAQVGVPANTEIIIGHAVSGLSPRTTAVVSGGAFAAQVAAGTLLTAGPEWPVTVCGSTNGQTRTNSSLSLNLPGVLTTGTLADTVKATGQLGSASGTSTATVQKLSLLGGLVSADAVEAAANVAQNGSAVTSSDHGSSFVNLVVNGQSIPASVPANTKIPVGNLTVWVHRVITKANGVDVRMLEIVAHGSNPFGLPLGADIIVANADMYVFPVA
jgi:hypothetical protein